MLIGMAIVLNLDIILSLYKLQIWSREMPQHSHCYGFCVLGAHLEPVTIVGVLRAGGDTRFSMLLDAGTVWLVGVPLALVCGLVLEAAHSSGVLDHCNGRIGKILPGAAPVFLPALGE